MDNYYFNLLQIPFILFLFITTPSFSQISAIENPIQHFTCSFSPQATYFLFGLLCILICSNICLFLFYSKNKIRNLFNIFEKRNRKSRHTQTQSQTHHNNIHQLNQTDDNQSVRPIPLMLIKTKPPADRTNNTYPYTRRNNNTRHTRTMSFRANRPNYLNLSIITILSLCFTFTDANDEHLIERLNVGAIFSKIDTKYLVVDTWRHSFFLQIPTFNMTSNIVLDCNPK